MKVSTEFKLANWLYWVAIILAMGYLFTSDHWTRWVAAVLAACIDISKTKFIRKWERYNISQEKKETK